MVVISNSFQLVACGVQLGIQQIDRLGLERIEG